MAKRQPPLRSKMTPTLILVMSGIIIAMGVVLLGFSLFTSREASWFSMWFVPIYLIVMGGYLVWANTKALRRITAQSTT